MLGNNGGMFDALNATIMSVEEQINTAAGYTPPIQGASGLDNNLLFLGALVLVLLVFF